MAANSSRKQIIVSSLCRHFKLNPGALSADVEKSDVKTLYSDILKLSANDPSSSYNEEITKWIAFAEEFLANSEACLGMLQKLNEDLAPISVLLGKGLKTSEADVIVFSAIHAVVAGPLGTDAQKLPHLMRWMDHVQNKEDFGESLQKISVEKAAFIPFVAKPVTKAEDDSTSKKNVQNTKSAGKSEVEQPAKNSDQTAKKSDSAKKPKVDGEAKQEKKKTQEPVAAGKDEVSVSLLNIQVGHIRKAWKHPSADSLLVEEIDVGEGKVRQVVSGLAKFCSPEELTNRLVVLITNVKPGKLRDVMSEGLVLCASNEDHSVVEPLLPPQGAKIGESVVFSGIDGKPEDVLNPKKKQLDKITPHLFTDDKGVATYKGIPFMTSAGPCTSSIPKATIK